MIEGRESLRRRLWMAVAGVGVALLVAAGAFYAAMTPRLASEPQTTLSLDPADSSAAPTSAGATPSLTATPTKTPTPTPSKTKAVPGLVNTRLPVRAAFYYPWYPENFQAPASKFMPSAGHYNGDDAAVITRQIKDMQYAGLQAGIASWWGRGLREDRRLGLLMAQGAKLGFAWSAYYEAESLGDPSAATLRSDLQYLRKYADKPAWLHVSGKPVIFVYADGNDACAMATRWADANAGVGYYVVLKVFGGYRDCARQPQGWHQYAPGGGLDVQKGYSAAVSPGFFLYSATTPLLARDANRFRQDATTVATSKAPFQLVTTYNEWGEGTSVESTTQWPSASGHGVYMDILREVFAAHPR